MKKPKRLRPGDKVGIVSLSWGGLGDPELVHKYHIAEKRLREDFGLTAVPMPHALKGSKFAAEHPELRASDLMAAFADPDLAGVFCAIGGDDGIRTLPYVDLAVLRANPKVFMGYSDSTVHHFMMYKAGLVSFYGPSVMAEFGEYTAMFDYTQKAVQDILFTDTAGYVIPSSPEWSPDYVPWCEANRNTVKVLQPERRGHEVLQGSGVCRGRLLGGCIDVFPMCVGTAIWPSLEQWQGTVLFLETSEEKPSPDFVIRILRNLAAQGILKVIRGILVGKPQGEVYYEEYKRALVQVTASEEGLTGLPLIYNVNFGHAAPGGILPYGIEVELNCSAKTITLLESATGD